MAISTHPQSRKIEIFILFIIVFALTNTIHKQIKAYHKNRIDSAVEYEQKFKRVRGLIPDGETVSLVSDETDSGEFAKSLFLTQYVLAPVKVFHNSLARYVITCFRDPLAKKKYATDNHLTLIKEIDHETALYKRTQ